MNFYTDHHYVIGQNHVNSGTACQDYACSGLCGDTAYAVVSDGCSTAGETDIGARLIALSTVKVIRRVSYWHPVGSPVCETLKELEQAQFLLGLNHQDMLATCVQAVVSNYGGYVDVQGDGVIAIKYVSGDIAMTRLEWKDNVPWYMTRVLDKNDIARFIDDHGGNLSIPRVIVEKYYSSTKDSEVQELPLTEGMAGITTEYSLYQLQHIEQIAIFSDGVCHIENQDWKDVVYELMAFKNTAGVFAKRRMNFFVRDLVKSGRKSLDDLSMAVIRIEH